MYKPRKFMPFSNSNFASLGSRLLVSVYDSCVDYNAILSALPLPGHVQPCRYRCRVLPCFVRHGADPICGPAEHAMYHFQVWHSQSVRCHFKGHFVHGVFRLIKRCVVYLSSQQFTVFTVHDACRLSLKTCRNRTRPKNAWYAFRGRATVVHLHFLAFSASEAAEAADTSSGCFTRGSTTTVATLYVMLGVALFVAV